jgi:hypothetical protein
MAKFLKLSVDFPSHFIITELAKCSLKKKKKGSERKSTV